MNIQKLSPCDPVMRGGSASSGLPAPSSCSSRDIASAVASAGDPASSDLQKPKGLFRSQNLTLPHLISSHLISSHLISTRLLTT